MRARRANRNNNRQLPQNRSDTARFVGFVAGVVVGGAVGAVLAFVLAPLLIGAALAWISATAIIVASISLAALLGLEMGERAERAYRFRRVRADQPVLIHPESSLTRPVSRVSHRESRAQGYRQSLFASPLASAVECAANERKNDERLQQESEAERPNKFKR